MNKIKLYVYPNAREHVHDDLNKLMNNEVNIFSQIIMKF